jgi:hypothetical protein
MKEEKRRKKKAKQKQKRKSSQPINEPEKNNLMPK